jgi:hypothetical protein
MDHSLIVPMTVHVGLTALLYVLLTIARAPKVWGIGARSVGSNPWANVEPRISANLSNQFEWPVFFYVACLLMMHSPSSSAIAIAWVFVIGRFAHSYVQIMTSNVRLRGLVFTISLLATLALWAIVLRDLAPTAT